MTTYFDVIPLDLRRLVLIDLPFEKTQSYCSSATFRVPCDEKFWMEYNSLHYFIEPEDYFKKYNAHEMTKWINKVLNEYFNKKSIVSVRSLKEFIWAINDPNSLVYIVIIPSLINPMINTFENAAHKYISTIVRQQHIDTIPINKSIVLPINSSEFEIIYRRLQEIVNDNTTLDDLKVDPILNPLITYLIGLFKKKTPYFVPGGIKYIDFDIDAFNDMVTSDGESMYGYNLDLNDSVGNFISDLFVGKFNKISDEQIEIIFGQ